MLPQVHGLMLGASHDAASGRPAEASGYLFNIVIPSRPRANESDKNNESISSFPISSVSCVRLLLSRTLEHDDDSHSRLGGVQGPSATVGV
jgi:hypothetical protein